MMKQKNRKYLLIAVGVLALLMLTMVVLVKVLITPERIKMVLIPRAEQALQRPIEIGDVEISIFSGILLKDLVIREKTGDTVFIAADTVSLDYQFWPLLQKRLVVDEVLLDQPKIRVERLADGNFNFSDLLDKGKADTPLEEPVTEGGEKRDVDLLISTIMVRGGDVNLVDHQVAGADPFHYQLNQVALQIDSLSFDEEFPFRLEALLDEAPLNVSGRIDPSAKSMQVSVSLAGFDAVPFSPYFKDQLPGQLRSSLLDLNLTLAGDEERLKSEGSIDITNLNLQLEALPDAPLKNGTLGFEYALQLDQPTSSITVSRGRLVLNGVPVMITGKITDYASSPMLDLILNLPNVGLSQIVAALPAGMSPALVELNPSGEISARLQVNGSTENPEALLKSGEIQLVEVQAEVGGQRPSLTGLVTLKGKNVASKDLIVLFGENRALLDLQVKDYTVRPMQISTALTSDRFHVDPLLQKTDAPNTEKPVTTDAGKKSQDNEEIGPLDLPIKLNGTARIGQVLYKNLIIEQLQARYRIENNILYLDEMKGNVAGGTFNETARVDLGKKGLEYTGLLNIKGVQVNPLVTAFFPKAAETVFGGLDLKLDLSGKGTQSATIKRTLTAQGDVLLQNGKVTGAGLVTELADFLDLDELRVLSFQETKGNFTVNNGRIKLDSVLSSDKLQLAPKGSVGLDGGLDLDLGLRLSPPLVSKLGGRGGDLTTFLKDQEGWARVPLNLAGTVQKPRFSLDSSAIKNIAEEKAKGALRKTLQEQFLDKKAAPEGEEATKAPAEEAEPAEKLLEGVFKGLFGN